MRRKSIAISLLLFAAACAPRPQAASVPAVVTPTAPPSQLGGLYGLNVQELANRFGKPALQIHEGNSVKLQFRSARCVLDAYLYPSSRDGQLRVTYVDTRLPSGADMNQAACISALQAS
jgi:hypothetical protein